MPSNLLSVTDDRRVDIRHKNVVCSCHNHAKFAIFPDDCNNYTDNYYYTDNCYNTDDNTDNYHNTDNITDKYHNTDKNNNVDNENDNNHNTDNYHNFISYRACYDTYECVFYTVS